MNVLPFGEKTVLLSEYLGKSGHIVVNEDYRPLIKETIVKADKTKYLYLLPKSGHNTNVSRLIGKA